MAVLLVPKEDQANGAFNGGAILEKKPIGFSQDGGKLQPYSNLFYWAHAWSEGGSTIGEHPHKGFEILSFILKGEIEHYDSKNGDWKQLKAGDVQIIRAGSGITHAERLHASSEIFQIWLDPNLNETLAKPASYDDYQAELFPVSAENGITTKIFKGENAPMEMHTEGITIRQFAFQEDSNRATSDKNKRYEHTLELKTDMVYSAFLIKGMIEMENQKVEQGDFVIVKEREELVIKSFGESTLFVIESPLRPGYTTYAEKYVF